jgi:DNA repair protein RAD16
MVENRSGSYGLQSKQRKALKILPNSDFASHLSDDDSIIPVASSSRAFKKPKVELGSQGSNEVKFTYGKKPFKSNRMMVMDSEESDAFVDIGDSENDDDPIPMFSSRSRMQQDVRAQSKAFKAEKTSPQRGVFKTPLLPVLDTKPSTSAFGAESFSKPETKEDTKTSATLGLANIGLTDSEFDSELGMMDGFYSSDFQSSDSDADSAAAVPTVSRAIRPRGAHARLNRYRLSRRAEQDRARLELHHPELNTMWQDLENLPKIGNVKIEQPTNINRELKPFQLEGVAWMKAMEQTQWGGGLLGDEMGMGKTIQAVSLIMSDFPAAKPSLVLVPPVALMQWQQEITSYTDGTLKTFVYHGTNTQTKSVTLKELKKYNIILLSYNSLESMYRKQEKGFKRKNGLHKEKSLIHQIHFHRAILDEAHNIKVSSSPDLLGSLLTIS